MSRFRPSLSAGACRLLHVRRLRESPVRRNLILLGIVILLGWLVPAVYSDTIMPGYLVKATSDAHQVGLTLKLYADDHGGKIPASLATLTPDYVPDARLYQNMRITAPNVVLRDLPVDFIIAIRTVPEDARYIVAIYSTTATTALKVSPTTSNSKPVDTHSWPLISVLGAISGWLVALTLWIRHRSKPTVA